MIKRLAWLIFKYLVQVQPFIFGLNITIQVSFLLIFIVMFFLKGTYSTQIFSLAVLLSSMFIYNQVDF